MGEILFQYNRVSPTTWSYLSSLLTFALFFKFSRVWAVRNLDLLLLMLLAPALLCVKYGADNPGVDGAAAIEVLGHIWLFSVNALLILRMLLDSTMVRRPLLEPNLTADALSFLAVSLMLFLAANVMTGTPYELAPVAVAVDDSEAAVNHDAVEAPPRAADFAPLWRLPIITTQTLARAADPAAMEGASPSSDYELAARLLAIFAQLMIVVGIVLVGWRHFESVRMGVAAATLYLLLPYTAMWIGAVTHALPGALLVWAVFFYRQPVVAGLLIGLMVLGTIHYPVYLLPLWASFYWSRGLKRFATGVLASTAVIVTLLVLVSPDATVFGSRVLAMLGVQLPRVEGLSGVWDYWYGYYRYPLIAVFAFLSVSLVLWPAQKNLSTLLSCSAALMLGTQFWHANSGGVSLAWCLPVMLLAIFRPNLEDRVAVEVVAPGRRTTSATKTS